VFIWGKLPLVATLCVAVAFILVSRAYIFANITHVPVIFKSHPNKGTLGTMMTLSAWIGFAIVSTLQAELLPVLGLNGIALLLCLFLLVSNSISYYVQRAVVFKSYA